MSRDRFMTNTTGRSLCPSTSSETPKEKFDRKMDRLLEKTKKDGVKALGDDYLKEKSKLTWKYLSAEFGTNKQGAIQMINNGYLEFVADNFDKFSGLDKDFAMFVLKFCKGNGFTVYGTNHKKGKDGANATIKLCELIAKNAGKITGLDKEFFDLYLDFNIKVHDEVTCGYGMRYSTSTNWNSIEPLLDSIKSIEGVDEKLLFNYGIDLIKSYETKYGGRRFSEGDPEGDRAGDAYRRVRDFCVSFVKKSTLKIPKIVWDRVNIFKCFDESNLDFSAFYDRLEGFNFNDYFKYRLGNNKPSRYSVYQMERNISIDDFEKLLKVGCRIDGIGRYLKLPTFGTVGSKKRYSLIVKYLGRKEALSCFRMNNRGYSYSLLCWLADYLSKHLDRLYSWGGFDMLKSEICCKGCYTCKNQRCKDIKTALKREETKEKVISFIEDKVEKLKGRK